MSLNRNPGSFDPINLSSTNISERGSLLSEMKEKKNRIRYGNSLSKRTFEIGPSKSSKKAFNVQGGMNQSNHYLYFNDKTSVKE